MSNMQILMSNEDLSTGEIYGQLEKGGADVLSGQKEGTQSHANITGFVAQKTKVKRP